MSSAGSGATGAFDVESFVRHVVDRFEQQTGYGLSAMARAAVVAPAVELRDQINEEVATNAVAPDQIDDAVMTVLRNAMRIAIARNSPAISEGIIYEALKLECRYFPWC